MRTNMYKTLLTAGILAFSAVAFGQTFTVGANNGSNTTTGYPAPMQDYYKTQRAQYLYLASELAAAGMAAGDITSLAWTVTAPYVVTDPDGGLIEDYTISLKNTPTASLVTTLWESGVSMVYGPYNVIPAAPAAVGDPAVVNTFTFDTPFYWDGVSNLLVEICGGFTTGEWDENAQCIQTTGLAFNGSRTYRSDVTASCGYTGTLNYGTATARPQAIFGAAAAADCTGAPVVGAASSTAASVCLAESFTVSIDPVLEGSIAYQWASSPDGVSYTDIAGATAASYITTQTSATYYQCAVTCTASGEVTNSDAVYVGMNAPTDCYCEPVYTTGTGFGDYIDNVTLGAINNTTGANPAPYYTYYAGISTDLEVGATYTITATVGTYSFNDVAAWIDYNQDGLFDEVTEKLGEVDNLAAAGVASFTFTVPVDAAAGLTRLRVREADQGLDIESCEALTYGETEDYDINITVPVVCDVTTGLWADGITPTSADLHWDVAAGATNYHVTVARTSDKVIVAKIQAATNSATVTGLTAGTDYGFQVRTFCADIWETAVMSDKYYFTTPAREGEVVGTLSVTPNPNTGAFSINVAGYSNNEFVLNVASTTGQIIYTKVINVNSDSYTEMIDMENAAAGMYQVTLSNDKHVINYPIIVTR